MSYVISTLDPSEVRTENGERYPYVALLNEDETLYADTITDIVAHYIGEQYGALPSDEEGDDEALIMRVQFSVLMASQVQASLVADAVNEGKFDITGASEELLTTLLGDRTIPVRDIDEWEHEVPLVLLTTDYAPYTTHAPPSGNVWWIDPSDERMFIGSLGALGVIQVLIDIDADSE